LDIQTEKSSLIDLLQKINDISLLEKVKAFVLSEIQPVNLTPNQKNELDKRFADHYQNKDSNMDAFEFLDNLKSK
jgi:hypothetical protein